MAPGPRTRDRLIAGLAALLLLGSAASCALPDPVRRQIDADLRRCEELRGEDASRPHAEFFGASKIDGRAYRRFFDERIREIRGEGPLWASCHGALACTDANGRMRVSTKYVELGIAPMVRISLLLHEARHAEGWPHVRCPSQADGAEPLQTPYQRTDLRGAPACDAGWQGALGVQYTWLRAVGEHCKNCSAEERRDALEYARFVRRLITSPEPADGATPDASRTRLD